MVLYLFMGFSSWNFMSFPVVFHYCETAQGARLHLWRHRSPARTLTVKPPGGAWVHFGGAGHPEWGLGTEAFFHKSVPLGFSRFSGFLGTDRVVLRIVLHGL